MRTEYTIEVSNLNEKFGELVAVDHMNFSIRDLLYASYGRLLWREEDQCRLLRLRELHQSVPNWRD